MNGNGEELTLRNGTTPMLDLLTRMVQTLFGPVLDYLKIRSERRVTIGCLIDVLLEARHRAAVIVNAEAELADALRDVPPQVRVLLRMALRAGLARLGPVANVATVEELRETLAGYHPGLAFRMRSLAGFFDGVLEPALHALEQEGSIAAAYLSNHLASELGTAYVDALDSVLSDLAELHGSEAVADVKGYVARFNEPSAERDRAVQAIVPMLRQALLEAPWHDPKAAIATFQHALDAFAPPNQLRTA